MSSVHTIDYYLQVIKRRIAFFILPCVLITGLAAVIAVVLPPVYQSSGMILVETQQVPTDLVRSTVTTVADERIQIIKQRVMTRENMLRIVDKFKLYADKKNSLTASEIVEEMREQTSINLIKSANTSRRRNTTTVAFKISFEHKSPALALKVASELVTLFLDENVRTRISRASETTDFLAQEATKLKKQLELIENQIATYKQEHSDALPESIGLRTKGLERAEESLREVDWAIRSASEEKRLLEIELTTIRSATRGVSSSNGQVGLSLAGMQDKLLQLRTKYSDQHPEVKRLKRQIDNFSSQSGGEAETNAPQPSRSSPEVALVDAKIKALAARMETFQNHRKQLVDKIQELEQKIIQTPQVERALSALTRDYDNALLKYEDIRRKQMEAQMAENLEAGQKAERFTLLEPPIMPDEPIKPNRKKIMLIGIVLAVSAGTAALFVAELLNRGVRTQAELAQIINRQPIAVIPFIETHENVLKRRMRLKVAALCFVLMIILATLAVHFLYMNLDLLLMKIAVRLGV